MTPSSYRTCFVSPDQHQPAPESAPPSSTMLELPRAMDQLAGDLSRQHLEHLDYLERMDQMWHVGHRDPPRARADSVNRITNPAAMETDGPPPPMVDDDDDDKNDIAISIATGRDFVLRPPSPDPDAMDLRPIDVAAVLPRLPAVGPSSAYTAARGSSTAAPPTPPLLPLSSEALAQPQLAPQHHQVPSSGYDLHSWLATASSADDPHQNQLQFQLEDARLMALSFQARRHYYQSLNRLSRQQQQQPSPSMASSTTSAGFAHPATGLTTPTAHADQASDASATPVTPASLSTDPPLPAWVGSGPLRYRLSAEVAMHCPNLVHSRPRMRRRKATTAADSASTRDTAGCSGSGSGVKSKGISKDKEKTHREHRASTAAATAAASAATARQAVVDEYRRQARAAEGAVDEQAAAEEAAARQAAAEQAKEAEQSRLEDETAQKGQNDAKVAGQATEGPEEAPPGKRKDRELLPDYYRGRDGAPGP